MLPAGQFEAEICSASAEEYAAKIVKLQQACLTPLKEDLADWLNKIMSTSTITSDNFMDKLDNGVIICRLAKVISLWCEQQLVASGAQDQLLVPTTTSIITTTGEPLDRRQQLQTHNSNRTAIITSSQPKLNEQIPEQQQQLTTNSNNTPTSATSKHQYLYFLPTTTNNSTNKLSISTLNVHSTTTNNISIVDVENCEPLYNNSRREKNAATSALATPLRQSQSRFAFPNGGYGSSRSSSQSTNCLTTSTSSNNGYLTRNQFLNNLIRMNQIKIWEDAKCRTFYARDNVCNFIKWSKEFGVNQSVLFESDDLVLHANTRQVVLCLLDVARIACVKHGFTEAPGLVKFEQEIDRELAAEKAAAIDQHVYNSTDGYSQQSQLSDTMMRVQTKAPSTNRKLSSLAGNSCGGSIDATDDLIMRYCLHKEEEAARKKAAEIEAVRSKANEEEKATAAVAEEEAATVDSAITNLTSQDDTYSPTISPDTAHNESGIVNSDEEVEKPNLDSDSGNSAVNKDHDVVMKPPSGDLITTTTHKHNLTYDNRVDSLDSGEGQTDSASTNHSRTHTNLSRKNGASSIPKPIKRTNSSSSLTSHTSSVGSELSSSRSSLLSANDGNSTKRRISSDLDGKVMKIAKSYYGKGATKGVTRLSEGKYKIADRIVFVRLLKGHRVMVRIGGGWDTLENFLFRHKSDPSQVIDVDNLLPLETKMTFEKSAHMTPTINKFSKLPYYRRSSSASSTNLSVSNLSVHSPTSSSATSTTNNTAISTPNQTNSIEPTTQRQSSITKQQIPYLFIHRNQNLRGQAPQSELYNNQKNSVIHRAQSKGPTYQKTPSSYKYNGRPLGNSKTPAASATNLYPATLTTRSVSGNIKSMMNAKLNSTTNLHNGRTPRQEAFFKLNQSNDSLQASYYKSQHRLRKQNGSLQSGNMNAKRKIDMDQRSTNGLIKQA